MINFPRIKSLLIAIGFISFVLLPDNSKAQTPVGKWTEVSSKQFLTEQGIKSYGRSVLETGMETIGVVTYTFLPDHSYQISSKSVRNSLPRTFTGTWTLTGNLLTMTSSGISVNSKLNIKDGILTLDTAYPTSDITTNVIVTFKKT